MLATICFYDQPRLLTHKVSDIGTNRYLPTKFNTHQIAISQSGPQPGFSWRLTPSELPRTGCIGMFHTAYTKRVIVYINRMSCIYSLAPLMAERGRNKNLKRHNSPYSHYHHHYSAEHKHQKTHRDKIPQSLDQAVKHTKTDIAPGQKDRQLVRHANQMTIDR